MSASPRRPSSARASAARRLTALLAVVQFNDEGLIPAVIQDRTTRRGLTLCYLNRDALAKSLEEGRVYVFRRSQGRVMLKGETSGHVQTIKRVSIDCEGQSLLFEIDPRVAGCHAGYFSCYYRRLGSSGSFSVTEKRVFDPARIYRNG